MIYFVVEDDVMLVRNITNLHGIMTSCKSRGSLIAGSVMTLAV